jgi:hypothetical protein
MRRLFVAAIALAGISVAATMLAAPALAERVEGTVKHVQKPKRAPATAASAKASIARAKAAIIYQLKDPDSVRWRNAAADDYGNVCIEVNARNSYGGYTGYEPVHYNGTYGSVAFDDAAYGACLGMKWRGKYVRIKAQ